MTGTVTPRCSGQDPQTNALRLQPSGQGPKAHALGPEASILGRGWKANVLGPGSESPECKFKTPGSKLWGQWSKAKLYQDFLGEGSKTQLLGPNL